MRIKIEVFTLFESEPHAEAARVLTEIAGLIANDRPIARTYTLRDESGRPFGTARFEEGLITLA